MKKLNSSFFANEASYWFKIITQKINKLKQVDDYLAKELMTTIKQESSDTKTMMTIVIAFELFAILFSMFMAFVVMNGIVKSIREFRNGFLEFFKYLNRETSDVTLLSIKSTDEIGSMAKVLNSNITKTKISIEEDRRFIDDTQAVMEELSRGWFSKKIQAHTNNTSLIELRNSVNSGLDNLKDKFVSINVFKLHSNFTNLDIILSLQAQ